jgi:hypothetical protein
MNAGLMLIPLWWRDILDTASEQIRHISRKSPSPHQVLSLSTGQPVSQNFNTLSGEFCLRKCPCHPMILTPISATMCPASALTPAKSLCAICSPALARTMQSPLDLTSSTPILRQTLVYDEISIHEAIYSATLSQRKSSICVRGVLATSTGT